MTKSSICGVTKAQKFGSGTIKLASSVFSEGKKKGLRSCLVSSKQLIRLGRTSRALNKAVDYCLALI